MTKNFKLNTFEIAKKKKEESISKNINTRSTLYVPFDERYKLNIINYGLYHLIELGVNDKEDKYIVPEYQRGLVWNLKKKKNLIFAIMNGTPIGEFIFSKKTIDEPKKYYHEWTIIDGQQRIHALREFVLNNFKDKDNRFFRDYSYREMTYLLEGFKNYSAIFITDLTLEEQVEVYLTKNVSGVAHTKKEINKAVEFLAKIKTSANKENL